jgi:PIN domain nuclease of toxin-antitoxin system
LSKRAARVVEAEDVWISPAVLLELSFLAEVGAWHGRPENAVSSLSGSIGLRVSDQPFDQVVQAALGLSWTRDPFDRLIVGHAVSQKCKLLTKDSEILKNYRLAVWD